MNFRALFVSIALLAPSLAFCGLSGSYKFWGKNASGEHYKGTAVVTKSNGIYSFVWTYEDGWVERGTGIRKGENLSVVYHVDNDELDYCGTILYKIDGKHLKGPFVRFEGTKAGFDHMKKVSNAIPSVS